MNEEEIRRECGAHYIKDGMAYTIQEECYCSTIKLRHENDSLRAENSQLKQVIEVKQPGFDMYYHGLFRDERKRSLDAEAKVAALTKALGLAKKWVEIQALRRRIKELERDGYPQMAKALDARVDEVAALTERVKELEVMWGPVRRENLALTAKVAQMQEASASEQRMANNLAVAYTSGWYSCPDVPPHKHADICGKCLECLTSDLSRLTPEPEKHCCEMNARGQYCGGHGEAVPPAPEGKPCDGLGGGEFYGCPPSPGKEE